MSTLGTMYRAPLDLDLSKIVGEFATQVRVGQFDLQFTFGPANFAVQSPGTRVLKRAVKQRQAPTDIIFQPIVH